MLPLRAAIVSRSTAGAGLTLTIACKNGAAGEVCSGPITLTASDGKEVGSGSYSIATGSHRSRTPAAPVRGAPATYLDRHITAVA